jgi:hypothetical protein
VFSRTEEERESPPEVYGDYIYFTKIKEYTKKE